MNPSTPCRPPGCGDELPHTRQAPQLPPLSGKMSTLCWQELLGFCRVWGQRDVGHGPAPKPLGLGSHEYGSARFGALTSSLLPLKLGRMRASYPEVRPISLSRKSEGDMGLGEPREPALISSRPETSLRGRGGRSAAVCWHQGSAGTFWQPVGTLSCQGRCACAASTPVPSQHAGGIPSFCWDRAGFSPHLQQPEFLMPTFFLSLLHHIPWHGGDSASWLQGCAGDRAQPELEGESREAPSQVPPTAAA